MSKNESEQKSGWTLAQYPRCRVADRAGDFGLDGRWWPGILVLVAISGIVEALIRRYAPSAVERRAGSTTCRGSSH